MLVKGVVRPDDAVAALDHGARGVLVSNHGGRQLDASPAPADVLAPIVDAVAGRAPVLVDGGIRRGVDVLRALALGARAVLVSRPVLWDSRSAASPACGACSRAAAQFDVAMALAGCRGVADVDRPASSRASASARDEATGSAPARTRGAGPARESARRTRRRPPSPSAPGHRPGPWAPALLEASPDYRVLRRFVPREVYAEPAAEAEIARAAIIVDTETTGTDVAAGRRDRTRRRGVQI